MEHINFFKAEQQHKVKNIWCGNTYYDLITEKTITGCNYIFFTNCFELLNVLIAIH